MEFKRLWEHSLKGALTLLLCFVGVVAGLGLLFGRGTAELYLQLVFVLPLPVLIPLGVVCCVIALLISVGSGVSFLLRHEPKDEQLSAPNEAERRSEEDERRRQAETEALLEAERQEKATELAEAKAAAETKALAEAEAKQARAEEERLKEQVELEERQRREKSKARAEAEAKALLEERRRLAELEIQARAEARAAAKKQRTDSLKELEEIARDGSQPFRDANLNYLRATEETSHELIIYRKHLQMRKPLEQHLLNIYEEIMRRTNETLEGIGNPREKQLYARAVDRLIWPHQLAEYRKDIELRRENNLGDPKEVGVDPESGSLVYVWEQAAPEYELESSELVDSDQVWSTKLLCVEFNGIAVALPERRPDWYSTITAEEALRSIEERNARRRRRLFLGLPPEYRKVRRPPSSS